jgi:hypothetical protein
VFIHIADPDDELQRRPEWSFYGKDFPAKQELLVQRNRVVARHPKTTFVCLHVANHPENVDEVTEWLSRYRVVPHRRNGAVHRSHLGEWLHRHLQLD